MSWTVIISILVFGLCLGGGALWLMYWAGTKHTPESIKLQRAQKDFGNDFGAHG